jgi:thiol-disulfide isomerase/thioredoxin
MATTRITMRLLAGLTLYAGFGLGSTLALPPTPKAEEIAQTQPAIPGVSVSTPAPADAARCRIEEVPGPDGKPIGHVVYDTNNRIVRRFLAVGTPNYNIKSFYLDGQEAYRETDAKGAGKTDQYRWLGANGSKWGLDPQGTGRVTNWARISPEEVSKELFEAIVTKDAKRVDAMLPTEAELKALGLPGPEIAKVMQRAAGAAQRLTQTAQALNLTDKAKWVHLELSAPQTTPKDAFNGSQDLIRHRNAGVLVDRGDGKADVFQTGELVLIGEGWRVIDGPAPGSPSIQESTETASAPPVPPAIQEFVKKLIDLKEDPANPAKLHTERAAILEQIVAKLQGDAAQESWLRQLLDAYYTAASDGGSKEAGDRLAQWKGQIDKSAPGTPIASLAGYKVLSLEYRSRTRDPNVKPEELAKTQTWWKEQLEAFVKAYPNTEETPEAIYTLAMAHEYSKDGEAAAKQWYAKLAKDFPKNAMADTALGAVRRLDSEGQPFQVTGASLNGNGNVSTAQYAGKVVIVYFWASWSSRLKDEAAFLADLVKKHGAKGLEVVTVSLDGTPQQAVQAQNAVQLPGAHMYQPGVERQYGIISPHIFLVGRDGKVVNKCALIPSLGDEVEKLMK